MEYCIFCKIVEGDLEADVLYRDEDVIAFRDINPQAPTHIQIIPTAHINTIKDMDGEAELLEKMISVANQLAEEEGISEKGYRLVINCGPEAGQSVYHVHLHLLGGRPLSWPPG
jgi:histidine triad (HIT) family protein